ncbi:MAG TPA: hypothetical protein VMT29_00465 [Steroidobacteraceae bacterium]|nr:hypothetical protein [Steroidobacteraceae bacterium]
MEESLDGILLENLLESSAAGVSLVAQPREYGRDDVLPPPGVHSSD